MLEVLLPAATVMMEFNLSQNQVNLQSEIEVLEVHQMTQDFRQEVNSRNAWETHCKWYEAIARQHRKELAAMTDELDIFAWIQRR